MLYTQIVVAVGSLVLIIVLRTPWSTGVLHALGMTDPGVAIQSALTVVAVAIFFDVRSMADRNARADEVRHFSDPMDVYPVLLSRAQSITRQDEKVIDVIGMTLYTAWPSIRFWINRSDFVGWTVRLAAVAHNDRRLSNHVPSSWFKDSRTNLNEILAYSKSPAAVANRVRIEAFGYDFMPALHGYRLGNGDLFYSLLLWEKDGRLTLDGYSYEYVPSTDRSPSAEAIRQVFDSWFRRVSVRQWSLTNGRTP